MASIKNPIWNFFEKKDDKAKCKFCGKYMSLGSKSPKSQTTSNVKQHLKKIHPIEYIKYSAEVSQKEQIIATKRPQAKQETLPSLLQRTSMTMWPDDHIVSKNIDKSIMDLILVGMLPYNVVEGLAFKRLNFDNPEKLSNYRKKTEKFFRTYIMPETYKTVKNKVFTEIQKAEWLSFTTDIWSNSSKTCSLLICTAHFVDGSNRSKLVLGASVLDSDHTGSYISDKLIEIIKDYNIENKIHIGVSDNAPNMSAAMRIGGFKSIGCAAHTIQLIIHDSLNKNMWTKELITECRSIVGHFKRSEQASRYLKKLQDKYSLPKHRLIQDIETRWNSTYLMLQRMVEQKNALCLYSMEKSKINSLSAEEWEQMKDLVNILESFYEATLDISGDIVPISVIIPLFELLKIQLDEYELPIQNSELVSSFKDSLKENLNKRFGFIVNKTFLSVATLLDPRFKSKYLNDDQIKKSKQELKTLLSHDSAVKDPIILENTSQAGKKQIQKRGKNIKASIWEKHDSIPHIKTEANGSAFDKELRLYINEPLSQRSSNIYEYWNSSPYNNLKITAVKYLSAPPTSVASEQLFSAAGQLYCDRRSNLHDINAEKLLFCHYNIKLFDFEY